MIEFLQDYQTKAIPPETFKDEERVERSAESELYFVRLGLAAYVTDDGLVDVDYRPIERRVISQIVETVDRRALTTGRAGELPVTVEAPARATTGPGNAAMFGGDQQTAALAGQVETLAEQVEAAGGEVETATPVTGDASAKPARRTVTPAKSA